MGWSRYDPLAAANAAELRGAVEVPVTPSYQTVRLSRGRHRSPEEGACVAELASMLKGRRFSDRVYCIDPAINAFLWGYNDHLPDELLKDLYRYAAHVLDTYGGDDLAARRAEMCRVWALQARSLYPGRPVVLRGVHVHVVWPLRFRRRERVDLVDCELAGAYVANLARRYPIWHSWTLGFVDMLVWLGSPASVHFAPSAHGAPATRSPLAPHRAERAVGSGDLSVDAAKPWWEAACTTS